jgi:hypothetical protein
MSALGRYRKFALGSGSRSPSSDSPLKVHSYRTDAPKLLEIRTNCYRSINELKVAEGTIVDFGLPRNAHFRITIVVRSGVRFADTCGTRVDAM